MAMNMWLFNVYDEFCLMSLTLRVVIAFDFDNQVELTLTL
jgi:hypothetical protein